MVIILTIKKNIMKNVLLKLTIFFLLISSSSMAADHYWIASANSNWNIAANWSSTSGGTAGTTVPGANDIVHFDGAGTGTCTLNTTTSVDAVIMSAGTFNTSTFTFTVGGINNSIFSGGTINGTNTFNIQPTGTARVTFSGTTFNPDVNVESPRIFLNGSTFNGTSYFEKTGAGNNVGTGGNTFVGNCIIKNSGTHFFRLGDGNDDSFSANLDIINSGTNNIYLAYDNTTTIAGNLTVDNSAKDLFIAYNINSSINITGTVTVSNTSTLPSSYIYFGLYGDVIMGNGCTLTNNATGDKGIIILATKAAASVTINGNTTVINQNGGDEKYIYLGNAGDITFNGNLDITNTSTSSTSGVHCSRYASCNGVYNGNIVVSASGSGCNGILFGYKDGFSTLSAGKTISIGSGGYTDGHLYLKNFTQTGATAQSITLTGTGLLTTWNSTWNGAVSFTASRVQLEGSTFNSNATIRKTGTGNDKSNGGNTYNGNTSIENNGAGYLYLASNLANDYNGNLSLIKSGSGTFLPVYNRHSTLAGDLNINTNSDLIIAYGSSGWLEFDGAAAQSINNIGAVHNITIRRMMTNNSVSDITLNTPLRVRYNLNLSNGNIITTATNILTMLDNSAVDAVSDNAYVSGPLKKIGNDAFKFPVGGTDTYGHSHYAAIGISAPSSTSTTFIAEYFAAGHANAGTFSAPLTKVSLVEHWDLGRTVGSGSINVYLYWTDGTRSGIGNPTDLRVAHWNGSTWEDKGNDGTTGSAASGAIAANGINSFSPFTFGTVNNVDNPLPIDLLSFDAQKEDESVRIDWTTASEINNDYFIIERTDDFKNIEVIQTVKGAGNSNEILNYFIYDNQPLNGTSYYRLTQVDFDGQQEVFEWKSVNFNSNNEASLNVYPNPSNTGTATISLTNMNGATDLEVLDIAGRIVYRKSLDLLETNTNIPLNLNLGAGVYIVRIVNNQSTLTQRLIVE